ncbi:hypothetical protein HNP67_001055 [Borreliella californiensis]|uniref:Uncharacterized protein n=1 Tax=Borreliella californiensis TaxID=373543 RepID=A0A7W9ZLZ4_9SPIR|nr:hypothetical protein [Borreliella californiensis]MBB6213560.1 hypothetical protein [Borreliella californiensis]
MENLSNKNNPQDNIQAEIDFIRDVKTLIRNLSRIDKSLKGDGYKYQDFNGILEGIKNVIEKRNLDLMFRRFPTFTHDPYGRIYVIRTTFYSTISGHRELFNTSILTENL